MYELVINPVTGTLQLVHKSSKENVKVEKEGEFGINQIHIVTGNTLQEYTLPEDAKETNWIKIFGKSDKGWILRIPQGVKVISGMRVLDHSSYIHSNMHRFDFIHLMFLGDVWYVENKSVTVGIS